eukprot:m.84301 g.84301  ORF g.84301 m.84301 type:complete len:50 (-) comp12153_c1_seq2:1195-1344(-)
MLEQSHNDNDIVAVNTLNSFTRTNCIAAPLKDFHFCLFYLFIIIAFVCC